MLSNTQRGAGNQQERQIGWIVGFVDGEGTFSVSINRNSTTSTGWQVFPEFIITQGGKSRHVLDRIQEFFGCGKVYVNRRFDNHREDLYRYCVRSFHDLQAVIVPFFRNNPLRTAKREDFDRFVRILDLMQADVHKTSAGTKRIAQITEQMNRKQSARYLTSSETIRRAPQAVVKI